MLKLDALRCGYEFTLYVYLLMLINDRVRWMTHKVYAGVRRLLR
jgi:hypothetical protein